MVSGGEQLASAFAERVSYLLFLLLLIVEIRVRADNEYGYEVGTTRLRGLQ